MGSLLFKTQIEINLAEKRDYSKTPLDEFYTQFDQFIANMQIFVRNYDVFIKYHPNQARKLERYMPSYRKLAQLTNPFTQSAEISLSAAVINILEQLNDPVSNYANLIEQSTIAAAMLENFHRDFKDCFDAISAEEKNTILSKANKQLSELKRIQKQTTDALFKDELKKQIEQLKKEIDILKNLHASFLNSFYRFLVMPVQNMMRCNLSIAEIEKNLQQEAYRSENNPGTETFPKPKNAYHVTELVSKIKHHIARDVAKVNEYVREVKSIKELYQLPEIQFNLFSKKNHCSANKNMTSIKADLKKQVSRAIVTNQTTDQIKIIYSIEAILARIESRLKIDEKAAKSNKARYLQQELNALEMIKVNLSRFSRLEQKITTEMMLVSVREILRASVSQLSRNNKTALSIHSIDALIKNRLSCITKKALRNTLSL